MLKSKKEKRSLIVRMSKSQHVNLVNAAKRCDLSINKFILSLLAKEDLISSVGQYQSQSLNLLTAGVELSDLKDSLVKVYGSKLIAIAIFGSVARGTASLSSDLDLLIVLDRSVKIERDLYDQLSLRKLLNRDLSPVYVNLPETSSVSPFWMEIAMDGVVIYDKDLILNRFLIFVRDLIVKNSWYRKFSHGQPYWVKSAHGVPTNEEQRLG